MPTLGLFLPAVETFIYLDPCETLFSPISPLVTLLYTLLQPGDYACCSASRLGTVEGEGAAIIDLYLVLSPHLPLWIKSLQRLLHNLGRLTIAYTQPFPVHDPSPPRGLVVKMEMNYDENVCCHRRLSAQRILTNHPPDSPPGMLAGEYLLPAMLMIIQLEEELNTKIYPGTEIMSDVGSHHFVKSSLGSTNVLVPQPSADPHDPLVRPKSDPSHALPSGLTNLKELDPILEGLDHDNGHPRVFCPGVWPSSISPHVSSVNGGF